MEKKEQDYQRDCRLLLQQKNYKQILIHSPPTRNGVETPSKLSLDIAQKTNIIKNDNLRRCLIL